MEIERECGLVTETKDSMALVETDPVSFCMSCASRDSCPTGSNPRTKKLWMENSLGAGSGDRVYFYVPGGGVIASSFLIYVLPLVLLFTGIVAGTIMHAHLGVDVEAAAGLFGIIGFGISFIIIRVVSGKLLNREKYMPKMLEIESSSDK